MRIAFFADNFYPELSGIVDSILLSGKELLHRGHSIVYVGPRYEKKDYALSGTSIVLAERGQLTMEEVAGMPTVRLPSVSLPHSPTGQSRIAAPTGSSFHYFDMYPPDIVHTNSPYGCGIEALRVARRYRVPLIGTNHTAIEDFYRVGGSAMRHFEAWYYNHCQYMSAPYSELISNMKEYGLSCPAEVIPNPVELSMYRAPHTAEKTELKHKMGFVGPVILYCGRLSKEKHVDEILSAVAKLLPRFPDLLFVATGHGEAQPHLEGVAQKLGVEKNVRFPGFIPSRDLMSYYQAADVFAFMSTSDSQSLALMQAFATGVPAVGARARGLIDYIPPQCGFLVAPGDSKTLAERLAELLENTVLHEQMSKAAVLFVKQFAPEVIASRWEKIYTDVFSRSSSSFSSRSSRDRIKRVNA